MLELLSVVQRRDVLLDLVEEQDFEVKLSLRVDVQFLLVLVVHILVGKRIQVLLVCIL